MNKLQPCAALLEEQQSRCLVDEFLTLYTAQTQIVKDTLEKDGVYHVKTAYVNQKYGDQAWIFKEAYSFFAQNAVRIVPRPDGAESGIWTYASERWVGALPGSWILKLRVPRDRAVLFDLRVWNKILNLQYVAEDDDDAQRFDHLLQSMGLTHSSQAFSTAFYPQVKSEIKKSWQRLFASADSCPTEYLQAGLWEVRSDWVLEASQFLEDTAELSF